MVQPKIYTDNPTIKGVINTGMPKIKGVINTGMPKIKGVIQKYSPFIIGRILKQIDHQPEPYYEVANKYGITIIIGE